MNEKLFGLAESRRRNSEIVIVCRMRSMIVVVIGIRLVMFRVN